MVPHCSEILTSVWHCCLILALVPAFWITFSGYPQAKDQCVDSARWSFSLQFPKILYLLIPRFCFVILYSVFASFLVRRLHFLLFRLPESFWFGIHVDQFLNFPKILHSLISSSGVSTDCSVFRFIFGPRTSFSAISVARKLLFCQFRCASFWSCDFCWLNFSSLFQFTCSIVLVGIAAFPFLSIIPCG